MHIKLMFLTSIYAMVLNYEIGGRREDLKVMVMEY